MVTVILSAFPVGIFSIKLWMKFYEQSRRRRERQMGEDSYGTEGEQDRNSIGIVSRLSPQSFIH